MKKIFCIAAMAALLAGCGSKMTLTQEEKSTIESQGNIMYVLNVNVHEDSLVLRTPCTELSGKDIRSAEYKHLARKMLETVQSPEQNGVGISGPQVGISRRVAVVCRMDKKGEPFEVYPNLKIISFRGKILSGQEGCLSIPGVRGMVPRHSEITISYINPRTLREVKEDVSGYSAIIFQHECDHLDGILYTDKAERLWTVEE